MNIISIILLSLFVYVSSVDVQRAVVVVKDASGSGNPPLQGFVYITNHGPSNTSITLSLTNIPDGEYGLHILDFGDFRGFVPNATISEWRAWGNIFNPDGSPNGCPENLVPGTNESVAIGDLGNWNATNNSLTGTRYWNNIPLTGENSVIGRVFAVYGSADDCDGTVNDDPTVIGMGIIGIANQALPDRNLASASDNITQGVCVLEGSLLCFSDNNAECDFGQTGVVLFQDVGGNGGINILGVVNGLTTTRGFHIHEFGDLSQANGTNVGSHWNPDGQQHGLPVLNDQRHAGDLGNIQNFDGSNAYYNNTITYPKNPAIFKVSHIIGRAVVIHESFDHGNDPTCPEGTTSGNAGGRLYFCVIGVANVPSFDDLFLPTLPDDLKVLNNTFTQVGCSASTTTGVVNGTTTAVVVTGTSTTGDNDNDNDDFWAVPEEASASALIGSLLLVFINLFIIFA